MIDIHSFTDLTVNTIVRDASNLCIKLINHVESVPIAQANIQHGFLAKMIFENPYLVNLCFPLILSKLWAWSVEFNPYFSCMF
jgi:hypothetical protein